MKRLAIVLLLLVAVAASAQNTNYVSITGTFISFDKCVGPGSVLVIKETMTLVTDGESTDKIQRHLCFMLINDHRTEFLNYVHKGQAITIIAHLERRAGQTVIIVNSITFDLE